MNPTVQAFRSAPFGARRHREAAQSSARRRLPTTCGSGWQSSDSDEADREHQDLYYVSKVTRKGMGSRDALPLPSPCPELSPATP